jgi:hypothetical protein
LNLYGFRGFESHPHRQLNQLIDTSLPPFDTLGHREADGKRFFIRVAILASQPPQQSGQAPAPSGKPVDRLHSR